VSVFVLPPSFDALQQRLRGRSKDSDDQIRRRLEVAREEVNAVDEYDYVVVNDEIDACVDRIRAIVLAARARRDTMDGDVAAIVRTFSGAGEAR
jgi:guanylate kinase